MIKKILIIVSLLMFFSGCSSMTAHEKENKRSQLDAMAEKAIAGLKEKEPDLQARLEKSLAYGVANMKVTKVPIVGAGAGEGVLVIKETKQRIYFTITRFDIGGGWGARSYKVLALINDQAIVDKWKDGEWTFQSGGEAAAGAAAADVSASSGAEDKGFSMHVLMDGGASITATVRAIHLKVNKELSEQP